MKIRIWQMVMDSQKAADLIFRDFDHLVRATGQEKLDKSIYMQTFEGDVKAEGLEDVFVYFNESRRPNAASMRSLSVSDVVEVLEGSDLAGLYYVDRVGFMKTEWQSSLIEEKEIRERIDLMLNDYLSQIYSRLGILSGDIDPFQALEWDEHCTALARLFMRLIDRNKGIDTKMQDGKVVCPLTNSRLIELATLFKDGLIEDDEESAMEYFIGECHMTQEELDFFGIEGTGMICEINDDKLYTEASKRMENFKKSDALSMEEVNKKLGISDEDLSGYEDTELE